MIFSPKIADFASDSLVLELCQAANLHKILSNESVDQDSRCVMVMSLYFMQLSLTATNGIGLSRELRCAFKFAALLWFHSIDGLAAITKRNLVINALGSLFVYARENVLSPRGCTEEFVEHIFGTARRKEREFTVNGLVNHSDQLDLFFSASARSGLGSGRGNASKGYCSSLPSFMKSVRTMIGNRNSSRDCQENILSETSSNVIIVTH